MKISSSLFVLFFMWERSSIYEELFYLINPPLIYSAVGRQGVRIPRGPTPVDPHSRDQKLLQCRPPKKRSQSRSRFRKMKVFKHKQSGEVLSAYLFYSLSFVGVSYVSHSRQLSRFLVNFTVLCVCSIKECTNSVVVILKGYLHLSWMNCLTSLSDGPICVILTFLFNGNIFIFLLMSDTSVKSSRVWADMILCPFLLFSHVVMTSPFLLR